MKKVILFSFLTLVGLIAANSWAVNAPTDSRGDSLGTIDFVGANLCNIDASTGTATVVCNSSITNVGISLGRAIVYGVIISSIPQADFLVLKDTTGVGSTGLYRGTQSELASNASTVAIVSNFFAVIGATVGTQPPFPLTQFVKFPVPLQFKNGITANVNTAPAAGGVSRWTILYRNLDATKDR